LIHSERRDRQLRSVWLPATSLAFLALLQMISYAHLIPPWQGPDEPRHFEYAALLARRLGTTEPAALDLQAEILTSMMEHRFWERGYFITPYDPNNPPRTLDDVWPGFAHETHQPPLYYHLAAGILRAYGSSPIAAQLMLLRYISALLGTGVILLAWFTAHTLFPHENGLALGIALFIALLPMHSFINATVNNDNLVAFLVALELYVTARIIRHGLRFPEVIALLLLTGLALGTKRTGFIAPVILVVALVAGLWDRLAGSISRRGKRLTVAAVIGALGVVSLAGLAVSLVGGPGMSRIWSFFRLPQDAFELLTDGSYVRALLRTPYPYYTRMVFESFWARFGWLNIRLPDAWYWLLAGICVLAGIGLVVLFAGTAKRQNAWQAYQIRALSVFAIVVVLACALILVKEIAFLSYQFGVVPQGRYLFPVIVALATLLVVGLRELTPARWRRWVAPVAAGLLFAFNMLCMFGYIVPHYYGT
jgi:4-amino-4-deoxy-L-arabinose transferase-like glycosyltransferase